MQRELVTAPPTPKRRGGYPQKYHLTEERREVLLQLYDSCNRGQIAKRFGVPVWCVSKWARELGVGRSKEPRWTSDELDYLESHVSRTSWTAMAKKLGRSKFAVQIKAKRLGLRKLWTEGLTKCQVARAFGIDDHRVRKWIDYGWLKARRRRTDRTAENGGDAWLILEPDLRRFIAMHPEEIDLRRIADKTWFIDLLVGELRIERAQTRVEVDDAA